MTRGTAILLTNFKSVTTCEFNGDMYIEPDSNGQILLYHLENVKTVRQFKRAIEKFNDDCFGYTGIPLHLTVKKFKSIKFKESTYFKDWFSDYLFFLNISWFKRKIIDMDGKEFELLPGELAVFYFGKFYMSYNFHFRKYSYVPLPTPQQVSAKQS